MVWLLCVYGLIIVNYLTLKYNISQNMKTKNACNKNVKQALCARRVSGIIVIMCAQSRKIGKPSNFKNIWEQ